MSVITTVRGDIDPAELGFTSFHEHLNADMSLLLAVAERVGSPRIPPDWLTLAPENLAFLRDGAAALSTECSTLGDLDFTTAELQAFRRVGGNAVCDASPIGIRGDVRVLRDASAESGAHVITATGLYVADARPAGFADITYEQQLELFLREVVDGIDESGIRPGFLKCGLSAVDPAAPLFEAEVTTLKALARISAETGLSVHVHTAFPMSRDQVLAGVDVALNAGMDAERLVMMHMDSFFRPWDGMAAYIADMDVARNISTDVAQAVLDRGANIGLDSWSSTVAVLPDDWDRVKGLIDLLRREYGDHITLGHDTTTKPNGRSYGGWGYTRFAVFVPPLLAQAGFPPDVFQRLVVDNPARILAH